MLGLCQRHIIGVKPPAHILLSDCLFLMPQGGAVYVLYRLMHERTEEHSVRTNGHEFQFLVELILKGAGLVNRDMRRERVGVLYVHTLYRLEIKLPYIKTGAFYRLQFPVDVFEVVAGRSLVLIAGQDQ